MTVKEALNTIAYNAKCQRKAILSNMDYYPTQDFKEACEKISKNYSRISRLSKRDQEFLESHTCFNEFF